MQKRNVLLNISLLTVCVLYVASCGSSAITIPAPEEIDQSAIEIISSDDLPVVELEQVVPAGTFHRPVDTVVMAQGVMIVAEQHRGRLIRWSPDHPTETAVLLT